MLKLKMIQFYSTKMKAENVISYFKRFAAWQRWPLESVEIDGLWAIRENQDGVYNWYMLDGTMRPCKVGISR